MSYLKRRTRSVSALPDGQLPPRHDRLPERRRRARDPRILGHAGQRGRPRRVPRWPDPGPANGREAVVHRCRTRHGAVQHLNHITLNNLYPNREGAASSGVTLLSCPIRYAPLNLFVKRSKQCKDLLLPQFMCVSVELMVINSFSQME